MSRCVLGGVRHKTQHGRWQACAPDPPRVDQALSRGLPHLLECAIDAGARIRHDLVEPGRRIGWRAFCPQRGFLIGVQRVATRVGEQAIDRYCLRCAAHETSHGLHPCPSGARDWLPMSPWRASRAKTAMRIDATATKFAFMRRV